MLDYIYLKLEVGKVVVGNGLLGSSFFPHFGDRADFLIFASGVSNSAEKNSSEFEKESRLISNFERTGKCFVYFSSCSIDDLELQGTPYVVHKLRMENIVRSFDSHYIIRLPQVVGFTPNTNTLTNFLFKKIEECGELVVWGNATRNLIDIDHVVLMVKQLIDIEARRNEIQYIVNPDDYKVLEIVESLSKVRKKATNVKVLSKGAAYSLPKTVSRRLAKELDIPFGESYLDNLMGKYYG